MLQKGLRFIASDTAEQLHAEDVGHELAPAGVDVVPVQVKHAEGHVPHGVARAVALGDGDQVGGGAPVVAAPELAGAPAAGSSR